jgi:hypothetical protein
LEEEAGAAEEEEEGLVGEDGSEWLWWASSGSSTLGLEFFLDDGFLLPLKNFIWAKAFFFARWEGTR